MSTLSTPQFKIQLENRSIILGGTPEQSTSRLLQGHVSLYLRAPIRIKSIKLRLFGQMKLQWHESKFIFFCFFWAEGGVICHLYRHMNYFLFKTGIFFPFIFNVIHSRY